MARTAAARATKDAPQQNPTKEDFAALLDESFKTNALEEGHVVKGRVIAIEKEFAIIDVGLKTEGKIALKEFALAGQAPKIAVGATETALTVTVTGTRLELVQDPPPM